MILGSQRFEPYSDIGYYSVFVPHHYGFLWVLENTFEQLLMPSVLFLWGLYYNLDS